LENLPLADFPNLYLLCEQVRNNVTYLAIQNLRRQTTAVTLAGPDEEKFTIGLQMSIATIND
jgi:hypothetical protein